ncbi:hypothetical protein ACQY0O_005080 [Thecaphora frezii]
MSSPLFAIQSPISSRFPASSPASPHVHGGGQFSSHPDARRRSHERSLSSLSNSSAVVRRSSSRTTDTGERLAGLGVQAAEDSEIDSGTLFGGLPGATSVDSVFSAPALSNLHPILEGRAESARASSGSSQQMSSPSQSKSNPDAKSSSELAPSVTAYAGSMIENLQDERTNDRSRSESPEVGAARSPSSFRPKRLRLSGSLNMSRPQLTPSFDRMLWRVPSFPKDIRDANRETEGRSANASPSEIRDTAANGGSNDGDGHGSGRRSWHGSDSESGTGVYWNADKAKAKKSEKPAKLETNLYPSDASVSSRSSEAIGSSATTSNEAEEELMGDVMSASRSGSTFELVQWQVATESVTHLEDLFLPLGAPSDAIPATPLKQPENPMGLDGGREAALDPLSAASSQHTAQPLRGLGIFALDANAEGEAGPSDVEMPADSAGTGQAATDSLELIRDEDAEGMLDMGTYGQRHGAGASSNLTSTTLGRYPSSRPSSDLGSSTHDTPTLRMPAEPSIPEDLGDAEGSRLPPTTKEEESAPTDRRDEVTADEARPRAAAAAATTAKAGKSAFPERPAILAALPVLTMAWQVLFIVFPGLYACKAIHPALLAVAVLLFALSDAALVALLVARLSRRLRERWGAGSLANVARIWAASAVISFAYGVSLCVVQINQMARSSDAGAHAAGIHLHRTRVVGRSALGQVMRDVPFAAIVLITGCLALLAAVAMAARAVWRRRAGRLPPPSTTEVRSQAQPRSQEQA